MARGIKSNELNHSFVLDQIRKYNQVSRQTQKDRVLVAIGIHAGILGKEKAAIAPTLSQEDRNTVLYFLRQFCEQQGLRIEFR